MKENISQTNQLLLLIQIFMFYLRLCTSYELPRMVKCISTVTGIGVSFRSPEKLGLVNQLGRASHTCARSVRSTCTTRALWCITTVVDTWLDAVWALWCTAADACC